MDIIAQIRQKANNVSLGDFDRQYRTNELVRWRMHFSSDAIADFEGLLAVNREICKQQMAEKASPTPPTNCAVLPIIPSTFLIPNTRIFHGACFARMVRKYRTFDKKAEIPIDKSAHPMYALTSKA